MSDYAEMVASVERDILYAVQHQKSPCIEPEDAAQELRIAAFDAAHKYDPNHTSHASFPTYFRAKVRFLLIDIYRRVGVINRRGDQRKVQLFQHLEVRNSDGDVKLVEAVDPYSDEDQDTVDWCDFLQSVEDCGRDVHVIMMRTTGMTMSDIGDVFQVSESRISQILSGDDGDAAREKLRHLLGI